MNSSKHLSTLSTTIALVCGLGIAIPACSGDSQTSPGAPGNGDSTANAGQSGSVKGSGGAGPAAGGRPTSVYENSGGGGTTGSAGLSSLGGGGVVAGSAGKAGNGAQAGGGGASSCVQGVDTGSTCNPSVDTTECVRSTRTCTCEASGEWNCTRTAGTSGSTGTSGSAGASGSTGTSGSAGTSGSTGTSGSAGAAGGLGGAGGGSGSPATGYCPANEPCRISPLGDSITEGMGWTAPGASAWGGGYRVKLFSLAEADGKKITFVGTRSNGPTTVDGTSFPRNHEGTSGITIEDLQKNVIDKGGLTGSAVKPHIILLHIGTNNMYGTHSGTPEALVAPLLDKIIKDCPDALLVVAQLIPLPSNTSGIQTFNAALPALVDERAKAGAHIMLVDQFTGFPVSELGDKVHPDGNGYARMAGVWYKAISKHLR